MGGRINFLNRIVRQCYLLGAIILFFIMDKSLGDSIKCYKCAVTVEKYTIDNKTMTIPLCSKFDKSDDYVVMCPYSSMCLKTISKLYLQNGQTQDTITRGCAQQKNTTQVFRNKKWESEHLVQEVYQEGCNEIEGNSWFGSVTTHCYCRGNLCNSTSRNISTPLTVILICFSLHTLLLPDLILNLFNYLLKY